jgi:type I protein arginine methyltransferase
MSGVQAVNALLPTEEDGNFSDGGTWARRDFPAWHFAMVNDHARNRAIERSIAAVGVRGKTVVEIGSGTGLIALLFAKHGAARVVGCEMNANLAGAAQQIVGSTPYADRITIIDRSSTDAIERGLLPEEPDVIFTETLDCGVVGEGFGPIADDIRRIAGTRTVVMPSAVRQFAVLVDSVSLMNLNRAGNTCGFDLRLLNTYATGNYYPVRTELHRHRCLSTRQEVRRYTYLDCPAPTAVSVPVTSTGTVHGLLSWFSADFGAATVSNEPFGGSHWHQAFHPLVEDIGVTAGQMVSILIDDGGYAWADKRG